MVMLRAFLPCLLCSSGVERSTGGEVSSRHMRVLFCKGLNPELQSEQACCDEGKTLEQFIYLAIRLDFFYQFNLYFYVHLSPF